MVNILMSYILLLLGFIHVQHVTVLNTVGNCNTVLSIIISWDHCRICGSSLIATSLYGAWLYVGSTWLSLQTAVVFLTLIRLSSVMETYHGFCVVAVAYRGGMLGCSTPPPRNSEGPPKSCQTQPDCENC